MVRKIKTIIFGATLAMGLLVAVSPQPVEAATIQCAGPDGKPVTIEVPEGQDCQDRGLLPVQSGNPAQSTGGGGTSGEDDSCGVDTVILQCSGYGENPIIRAFVEIFNFFAVGIGILTVIGIILGGIKYITANGNSSQAEQGITIIVNAVIGLLLFIFMFSLINWLVPGGLFS